MKKITLVLVLALSSMVGYAQNFYTVSTLQQPYADLVNPTSINNGQVWRFNISTEIAMPFAFEFRGEVINRFLFDDDNFVFLTPEADYDNSDEGVYGALGNSLFLQDRTFSTGVSSSPISYKVDGTQGNRILKLEMKNSGFEGYIDGGFEEDQFYTNFQIWLYEADNAIEIRYGTSNLTAEAIDAFSNGLGNFAAIGSFEILTILSGDSVNPDDGEYTEATFPDEGLGLNDYPANGTVYRFAPQEEAGLPGLALNTIKLYPNPASSVLNIKAGNTPVSHYAIYDITGKRIEEQNITGATDISINVENLTAGIYFIAVNGQHLKFVKN